MREFFLFLTGDVWLAGYHVPVVVLIAAGLAGVSAIMKNSWPSIVGGLMLFIVYFLPAPY